ncbi:transcriptional regulator [Acuticoccus sp. M5D2P5]|uniref:transcriptional regulator n=1 Tax=Acuticoccus kalidii TaxID=2910977 RepID=UPI001F2DE343|nr:transcriptional regulator [Acuticoccus kalidii]MCF3934353.1 transcriptional regulator [Acuticoccus kalidii]
MAYLFDATDEAALDAMHVCRAWFADVVLPTGRRRLWTGDGPITIGGVTWDGTSDPFGGQLVSLTDVQEVRFGQAPAAVAVISGANRSWLKAVWDSDGVIGAQCDLYFAVFDQETLGALVDLKLMFQGKITGVHFEMGGGLVTRAIVVRIGSWEEALNYAALATDWSPDGQRSRQAVDRGLDYVGSKAQVDFRP